jgi:hypothetical protein
MPLLVEKWLTDWKTIYFSQEISKIMLKSTTQDNHTTTSQLATRDISIRRFPYPFRAMLAICSDLDGTPDGHVYFSMMKYLNTLEETPLGPGVGLEIGNTIYFDVAPPQFCYWNTSEVGRAMARRLMRSGHIDCLHSFGSRVTTRAEAARALEELEKHNCRLKVWVDHAKVPTNFGSDVTAGSGDIPGSSAYHADLTTDYGIQYIWRGRVTSIIGQDSPRSFRGIACANHPIASCNTIFKELIKSLPFYPVYTMHRTNKLMRETHLRSCHNIKEFMRSNPYWGGVGKGTTADGLPYILSKKTLNSLIKNEGYCILYTHLGSTINQCYPFSSLVKESLSLLSQYASDRKILVTTTRRLLDYYSAMQQIQISVSYVDGLTRVHIIMGENRLPLDGLSLYVLDATKTKIYVDDREINKVEINLPDHTGRPSLSIPWKKLEFPFLEKIPDAKKK